MSCTSCFKPDPNRELEAAKQAAQAYANETGEPMAVYLEGGEYLYMNAFIAYDNGTDVITVVSPDSGAAAG